MRSLVERAHFLKNALSDRKIGAVTMSSDYVIADVLRRLPKNPRLVIEYGPGEGAVTRAIEKIKSTLEELGLRVGTESVKNFLKLRPRRRQDRGPTFLKILHEEFSLWILI